MKGKGKSWARVHCSVLSSSSQQIMGNSLGEVTNWESTWRQAPQGGTMMGAEMARARNPLAPSDIALKIATRSAHMVSPKEAFSILHPENNFPLDVRITAPTGK